MANKAYLKGRTFEYKIKRYLEGKGYYVLRSAGSKGPLDLIAIKGKEILLIQCKTYKNSKIIDEHNTKCKIKTLLIGKDYTTVI
ncbi:MAG: restriction endonuclease [Candidatus Nitrosocaldaceae archaeon]